MYFYRDIIKQSILLDMNMPHFHQLQNGKKRDNNLDPGVLVFQKAAKAEMLDYIHAPNSERGKYSSFGRDFDDFRYHFSDDDEEL